MPAAAADNDDMQSVVTCGMSMHWVTASCKAAASAADTGGKPHFSKRDKVAVERNSDKRCSNRGDLGPPLINNRAVNEPSAVGATEIKRRRDPTEFGKRNARRGVDAHDQQRARAEEN